MRFMHAGISQALLAAVLFGASTPLAKALVGATSPLILAGLLYLGSGLGLIAWRALRRNSASEAPPEAPLARPDLPWLAGAVVVGGVIGPALLMWGLISVQGATASLLLNLEGVFTALIAWFVFRENFDARIALGMGLIVAAGALLSWDGSASVALPLGALAVIGACLCWAIDNNLTRKVAAGDAVQIAAIKGLAAGSTNLVLGILLAGTLPPLVHAAGVLVLGFFGYGVSLVLFVLALRHLGTARTGAYFSVAPFAGALIAMLFFGERPGPWFWTAAGLMAAGVWLHLTERHAHEHTHEPLRHAHRHVHDAHHPHAHDFEWDGIEPHAHEHVHAPITHAHPHYPDLHHRHRH
ncbi:MAG: DMT family transporter [Pseudomonadota bacterium]